MIRLLIKDYTLKQKKALYRALGKAFIELGQCSFDGFEEKRAVRYDIDCAMDWLLSEIRKEEMSNAQNR